MNKKPYLIIIGLLAAVLTSNAQEAASVDTVWVSQKYTTHILFPTDLIYADLSNKEDVDALKVGKNEDVLAIKARGPFTNPCNITAMESSGVIRTYILMYREFPETLIIDEKHGVYTSEPGEIFISDLYTSHMVFSSELVYEDLSNLDDVSAAVVEKSTNVLAIKANRDFGRETSSVTVLESDGYLHTYIIRYAKHPDRKIMNFQQDGETGNSQVVSLLRKQDAPVLKEVLDYPQQLYHIATRKGGISIVCENVFSYSDITYIILRITNRGGVSFEADRTNFVIGSRNEGKKRIEEETNMVPKNSVGTLTVAPGATSRIAFSLDKITLASNQVLRICVYELNGRREFFLTLSAEDVNLAVRPEARK